MMSIHRADSELARVNASTATNAVTLSPELFAVLQLAQDISAQTDGAFDVTIRPLAELWGFIWKQHRLPTAAELERTLPLVNYRRVELNAAARTVRFVTAGTQPGVESGGVTRPTFDLGGIGKGVAVDWAMAKLHSLGVTNAMVKAGGDLRVSGAPPRQTHWIIQIEDPLKEGRRVNIPLRDAALSTSGNYENYFEANGRRYSHILDPRTGLPVEGIAACTVIAPTCAESDAWATALFVCGPERSLSNFAAGREVRFVLMDGKSKTPGMVNRQSRNFPTAYP